ncbi:TPA: transposase [Pseudomonas aeruginosa]
MQSQRRSYSKSFKAQVVQECAQPGASIASVAQKHSLNANLVHKWIRVLTNKTMALQPAFIPVPLPLAGGHSQAASWGARRIRKKSYAKVFRAIVAA